jgi:superfamily II DNA/RNA helicase
MYLVRSVIPRNQLTIIFTATKHHSEFLYLLFEVRFPSLCLPLSLSLEYNFLISQQKVGLKSTLVYGSMDQDARNNNLKYAHLPSFPGCH